MNRLALFSGRKAFRPDSSRPNGANISCIYLRNHYAWTHYVREGVEVGIQVYSEDASDNPKYDFSRLNRIYGEFVKRGLKPLVDCDYMPKALTHNEADPQALKKAAELTVTKSYSGNSAEGE